MLAARALPYAKLRRLSHTVREIISICLACAGAQEKAERPEGRKVTRGVYFTYAWSDP